ncbi:MAG TPA: PspA/IM30 family protein [Verrucomicrobiae bacterium]|nr:PspA/IM30 family protein [Verrucomicrobiae bacterium]
MLKLFRKWWKYLTAKLSSSFSENADPKVQLEQALIEAQDQQRRLKEQAANVIAHQKQTEMRLNRTMDELEKVNTNAVQAVKMADQAAVAGDEARASQYTNTAQTFATRLIQLEKEVADLKTMQLQATGAADQAKKAVSQNAMALQQKLAERQKLLSQLDQAKMQETMNKAMSSLSETVGQDVPTLNEVRDKIEARYAKAKGAAELNADSVEVHMLEVEAATMDAEATTRLDEIKAQLGIATAPVTDAIPAIPATQPQEAESGN